MGNKHLRLPDWIKAKAGTGLHSTKQRLRHHRLFTVCEEARCPNTGMCFSKPTATFMILGSTCTRNCSFCCVETRQPQPVDSGEPERIANAARELGLKYVVITSVTRDDLTDGGALHFSKTVNAIRSILPDAMVEILTPDFKGSVAALETALQSAPDVFNHNIETVPRLYPAVRPQAIYTRSLKVLNNAHRIAPEIKIKSGLMVGLGETFDEVTDVMKDLFNAGCSFITIGQYLRPTKANIPVSEYIRPEVFDLYKETALKLGFTGVASAPLVRSSMNAEDMFLPGRSV